MKVKLFFCLPWRHVLKTEVELHSFFNSALVVMCILKRILAVPKASLNAVTKRWIYGPSRESKGDCFVLHAIVYDDVGLIV